MSISRAPLFPLLMLACNSPSSTHSGTSTAAATAMIPATNAAAQQSAGRRFHPRSPQQRHAQPRQPPPPSPSRAAPPQRAVHDNLEVIVSSIDVKAGQHAVTTIEIRPQGKWQINIDYPMSVALSGMQYAVTPAMKLHRDNSKAFRATSGGIRIDIPFTGDAPGVDEVSAIIKLGVCTNVCEIREVVSKLVIAVQPP